MTSPKSVNVRASASSSVVLRKLARVHEDLDACRACPNMIGPVVRGPAVDSRIFLLGQAPGPREGGFGRPFAWTAGRTLFRWFHDAIGVSEEQFRSRVYMAAVARCFPGKARGGGDRKPDADEIARCGSFVEREVRILVPELVIPVGSLAIEQVTGMRIPLAEIIGIPKRVRYHGVDTDVIALPHPSGASPWPRIEPGKTLLQKAMTLIADHPAIHAALRNGVR
jgi:uracil-DNA glycosylase